MEFLRHGTSRYRQGAELGPACWPHGDCIAILRGSFLFTLPESGGLARAGDLVILPARTPFHAVAGTHGGTVWVCHFRPGRSRGEAPLRRLERGRFHLYAGGVASGWQQALVARISELHQSGGGQEEKAQLLALLLHAVIHQPPPGIDSPIRRALAQARERGWSGVTIARMAEAAGYSPSHFRARFKAEIGASAGEYLKARRLERARLLLRESDLPIKSIGAALGYSEASAFHHAFVSENGMTPAEYRRRFPKVV